MSCTSLEWLSTRIEDMDTLPSNYWLSKFVMEAAKKSEELTFIFQRHFMASYAESDATTSEEKNGRIKSAR